MKLLKSLLLAAAISLASISTIATAHEVAIGNLVIDHPILRETPPGTTVSAGYLTIVNNSNEDDKLISASSEVANIVEIHEMVMSDSVMRMSKLEEPLVIPAGKSVKLQPGGLHLMLMGLKQDLKENELIKVTLTFEKAGTITYSFMVEKIAHHHH